MTTADSLGKLYNIFTSKNWIAKDDDGRVYNAFSELLDVLEPEQRKLILEITDRYLWISGSEYESNIKTVLKSVPDDLLRKVKSIYLFPIVRPEDIGKAKSGVSILYDIKSLTPTLVKYKDFTLKILDTFKELADLPKFSEEDLLLLVDDFIGTGETLTKCVEEIKVSCPIREHNFIVISISCQENSYYSFAVKGIKIFSAHLIKKGISDHYAPIEVLAKKKIMQAIENSIPGVGGGELSLGYSQSEATITLKRTPDNTFPFFWKKYRKGAKFFSAPFTR